MTVDLSKYAQARVPRYTSYPTAPHFHAGVSDAEYRAWLADVSPSSDMSVYLHVPYCQQLCWYCGCNALVANRPERVHAYATVQNATRPHEYSTEFSGPTDDVADLYGEHVLPKDGKIELSDRPGLGIELNEAAVTRLTVK